jgi:hypothetical protein
MAKEKPSTSFSVLGVSLKVWLTRIRSQEDMEKAVKFSKEMYQAARMEWTMDKFRVDYGKWDAVMEVSFSVKEEGFYETSQFLKYSQLKMPHSAPTEGYVPTWRYEGRSYKAKAYRRGRRVFSEDPCEVR